MSLSTLEDTIDRGLDACIVQCGRLLSIRWWAMALGGGYPEVQAIRRVFKVSLSDLARANGCHLPFDNPQLAKAMLGHVCFDAAMETAARLLQSEWSICGGYALSCLMRSTEPHAKYKYVEQIFSPEEGRVTEELWQAPHGQDGRDKTFDWGDVDWFLTNTALHEHVAAGGTCPPRLPGVAPPPWEWTHRKSRQAVRHAITVFKGAFGTVAGYGDQLRSAHDPASFATADCVDRGYCCGVRNFEIGHHLLGRTQSIQLVITRDPPSSALKTVLGFDMTHCAIWMEDVALKLGEPEVTLGLPCEQWMHTTLQRKGYMPKFCGRLPPSPALLKKRQARRRKYRARGFSVSLISRKSTRVQRVNLKPVHVRLSLV